MLNQGDPSSLEELNPAVGQLLYREELDPITGKLESVSLFFIDTDERLGTQYLFTQLALIENSNDGMVIYTGCEAGGMGVKIQASLASDENILMFIKEKIEVEDGIKKLANWVNGINSSEDCLPLLPEEKNRLTQLVLNVVLEKNSEDDKALYLSFLNQPFHEDGGL